MSEGTKRVKQTGPETNASEMSEQDLEQVAGGTAKDIEGVDIIIKRKGPPPVKKPASAA